MNFLGLLNPYFVDQEALLLFDQELAIDATEKHLIENQIANRLAFIKEKNWAKADEIRDALLEKGIQLKDGKDPATGERVTTWELKR